MQLLDYLHQTGTTMNDFAEAIQRAQSIVSRIANKKHYPDHTTARKIVEVTKGKCSLDDIFDIPAKFRGKG